MAWPSTHPSLLVRLRDPRDHAAWSEFDRLYGELVLRWAIYRGLDLVDAEDIRQATLVGIARVMPRFDYRADRGRFRSYLRRVVDHAVFRHGRRPYRRREVLFPGEIVEGAPGSEDPERDRVWQDEWRRHHVRRALRAVRATFAARSVRIFEDFLAGHAPEDVARRAGTTVGAAHKVKQRIRDRLRDLVREQIAEEERE